MLAVQGSWKLHLITRRVHSVSRCGSHPAKLHKPMPSIHSIVQGLVGKLHHEHLLLPSRQLVILTAHGHKEQQDWLMPSLLANNLVQFVLREREKLMQNPLAWLGPWHCNTTRSHLLWPFPVLADSLALGKVAGGSKIPEGNTDQPTWHLPKKDCSWQTPWIYKNSLILVLGRPI